VNLLALLGFLIGDRTAIHTVARCRGALWVGAVFVLAAGLARNYDSRDLLHEGWYVLVPLAASTVLASVLFALLRLGMRAREPYPGWGRAYRSFLGLFWMTAPLALMYAIPYDRMMSAEGAIRAKLWTLLVVSVWRVLLMSRVVSIVFGIGAPAAFWVIMLLGDGVVLGALAVMKLPLIQFMGGIRQTAAEQVLASTRLTVTFLGFVSLPVWAIGALVVVGSRRMAWKVEPPAGGTSGGVSRGVVLAAAAAVLVWVVFLPFTQPTQVLRWRTERELKLGHVAEGIAMLSAHLPQDYPRHWDPPPRPGYGEDEPPLLDVVQVIVERGAAEWVRRIYVEKLADRYLYGLELLYTPDADWARLGFLLKQLPEGEALREEYTYQSERRSQWRTAHAAGTTTSTAVPASSAP
jgi:hypothetical protein